MNSRSRALLDLAHRVHECANCAVRWATVAGFERYEVSDRGDIRVGRRMLKPTIGKVGYPVVDLRMEGRRKMATVHRLVAIAFLGPAPSDRPQVNHKDGTKTNNDWRNLEWVSHLENARHAWATGLLAARPGKTGVESNRGKLNAEQVAEIKGTIHRPYGWLVSTARRFGVDRNTILRVLNGSHYA